jgi:hypothetical protein
MKLRSIDVSSSSLNQQHCLRADLSPARRRSYVLAAVACVLSGAFASASAQANGTGPLNAEGCEMIAPDPHAASYSAEVKGEIRTTCSLGAPYNIHQTAQLWQTRWWGWDRIGIKGESYKSDVSLVQDFGRTKCPINSTFRTTGNGEIRDAVGTAYASVESRHKSINCIVNI